MSEESMEATRLEALRKAGKPEPTTRDEESFGGTLVQLGPGMYADSEADGVLVIHLGEVIISRNLDDTQEIRASIYGAWAKFAEDSGIELVLVRELDVPSVRTPRTG